VGYGIRELNSSETSLFCINNLTNSNVKSLPLIQNQVNFSSDFLLRTYTSGCYYYETNTGKWYGDEMVLLQDTNIQQTHCYSYHLTSFAGGLEVMPNRINFQFVFANTMFYTNYTIYLTLILFVILYLIFALWAIFMDNLDFGKLNIIPLKDNCVADSYFYELMVFTGHPKESGTESIVNINQL
jgi:hypothetical protein